MYFIHRATITVQFTNPQSVPADAIESLPIHIQENAPVHTCFENILSSSYPQLQNHHYHSCMLTLSFSVDHPSLSVYANGTVCVETSFDFETTSNHTVPVYVTFPDYPSISTQVPIEVIVLDVNEPPVLLTTDVFVNDTASPSDWFFQLHSYDPDVNQTVLFSPLDSSMHLLALSPEGLLTLNQSLQSNGNEQITLIVTLCDDGIPPLCSTSPLTVHIVHTETAPVCYDYEYHIYEHTAIGTQLLPAYSVVSNSSSVLYSLVHSTALSIHSTSGIPILLSDLDYETTPSHSIHIPVRATNINNWALYCEAQLTITIHDLPEAPLFDVSNNWSGTETPNRIQVNETLSPPSAIGNPLSFTDPDIADSHTFSLECLYASDCPFAIDEHGQVYLNNTHGFDYEQTPQWILHVQVIDSTQLVDAIALVIQVMDVNEPPSFSSQIAYRVGSYPCFVNDPIGFPVTATDPENNIVSYTIDDLTYFYVDNNGQIYLKNENINPYAEYQVLLTAVDAGGLEESITVIISFTMGSVSFEIPSITYSIPETTPIGSLLQPSLSPSGSYVAPLFYELQGVNLPFSIHNTSGLIMLADAIDYETQNSFEFQVIATDAFLHQANATITVHVTDVNESPHMDTDSCSASRVVFQNATTNTFLYPALTGWDPDEYDALTYSLSPIDWVPLPFAIHPVNGLLYVKNSSLLHKSSTLHYTFFGTVTDSGNLTDTCLIHVTVIPEDVAPQFAWIETDLFISESSSVLSTLAIPFYVQSDDALLFTIEDITSVKNQSYSFPFVLQNTELLQTQSLDYESQNEYTVAFCVQDSKLLQSCENITIHVVDVNEPPFITSIQSSIHISEDTPTSSLITTVTAEDPEQSTVHYSLLGNSPFVMHSLTGSLFLSQPLDYEEQNQYTLTVLVMDEEGLSASGLITILVDDVNEPPVCTTSPSISVMEDVPVLSSIGTIEVEDAEVMQGEQSLYYSLLTFETPFTVSSDGLIIVLSSLQNRSQSIYSISTLVEDSGSPPLACICNTTITVLKLDSPPVLLLNSTVITIPENTSIHSFIPIHSQIGNVNETQFISYFVQNSSVFGIHPISGDLYLHQPLDYETQSVYTITIGIEDMVTSLSDHESLTILVTDVNEPPILPYQVFSIAENATIDTVVGTVAYVDVDEGLNGNVTCLQTNLQERFEVDPLTCEIVLQSSLDYEYANEYSLQLLLQDGGGLKTNGTVFIHVSNVNEPPSILVPQEQLTIMSDTSLYAIILSSIQITDPEENLDSVILESPTSLPFELIHSQSMYSLLTNDTLHQPSYTFNLTAIDAEGLSAYATITVTVLPSSIPVPEYVPITCSIPEHSPILTILDHCVIQLTNSEFFASVAYNQQFSLASTAFSIIPHTSTTAQIQVEEDIDYEVNSEYVIPFIILAVDSVSSQTQSVQAIAVVQVTDVNEPPFFVQSPPVIQVEENLPANSTLSPCFVASDPESDPLTFSMTENEWFAIHATTGCLYVTQDGLDYENTSQPNEFIFTVTVSDSQMTTTTSVTLQLTNVNEPPAFGSSSYSTSIALPIASNSPISIPIEVTDPDSSLSFSILDQTCENAFTVNPASPSISTASNFASSEHNTTCLIHLQASDSEGLTDSTFVIIHLIQDMIPPTILSSSFSIQENPEKDDWIGTLESVSNCNVQSASFAYYLEPSSFASAVTLNRQTGSLHVNTPSLFDYESLQSFPLLVTVIDQSCYNVTTTKEVFVQLLNVNEPPIVQDRKYHIAVGAQYPLVLSPPVNAVDPEGSPIVYSFDSVHPDVSITNAGEIVVHSDLTLSLPEISVDQPTVITHTFNYTLVATDVGSPPLSTPFTVSLSIDRLYAGNLCPSYSVAFVAGTSITLHVPENSTVGTQIGEPFTVLTEEVHPILFYSITSCHPSCPFAVHSATGQLYTTAPLDFESVPSYSLNLTVTNGFNSDSIHVLIEVDDISDCRIHTIAPSSMPFSASWITFTGVNLGPQIESTIETSITVQFTIFNQLDLVLHEGNSTECMVSSNTTVSCWMPASSGHHIHYQLLWYSSMPRSVPHLCQMDSPSLPYDPLQIQGITGTAAIPTAGSSICFNLNSINPSAFSASVELYDSTTRPLFACLEREGGICCTVDKGYGTSLNWTACMYGLCDSIQQGSYAPPQIIAVSSSSSSSFNSLGGDKVILTGSNLGGDLSAITVYVEDDETQKPLTHCQYLSLHTRIECTMVPGMGSNLIFTVQVGDQFSPLYISSLSYNLPVIANVYGIGSANANTEGGQELYISGENLGSEDSFIHLHYGNETALSYLSPCHVLIAHSLLRCISAEGSGYQNQWQLTVGHQNSNVFVQQESIYGYPAVTSVESPLAFLPSEGGMNVTIHGLNFGSDSSALHVLYQNEDGIVYAPRCSLLHNHTMIHCVSLPGYGLNVSWSIEVNSLRSSNLFDLSYAPPVIHSISCKSTCGNVRGGDRVILHGDHFAPSSYVTASYGFSRREFTATACSITSTTTIECTTVPGVGQQLRWTVFMNDLEIPCPSSVTYSYQSTTISYPSQNPLPLDGGADLLLQTSNDFTLCTCCSFTIAMESLSFDAGVLNSTVLFGRSSAILTPSVQAHVLISCGSVVAEVTNAVAIPLQNPLIHSYMIDSTVQSNSVVYILSLFGSDFGFSMYNFYVYLNVSSPTGMKVVHCNVISVSNEYVSCMTSYSEGSVFVSRSGAASNTIAYYLNEVNFSLNGFDTSLDGYALYPYTYRTIGGEVLNITGSRIPPTSSVTVGNASCEIQFINSTRIECLVPEGEGRGIPVHVRNQHQVLFRFFINYRNPSITLVTPSMLQFETRTLVVEGDNFGLTPHILLSGIELSSIQNTIQAASHTSLSFEFQDVDSLGMVIQVETAHQRSHSVVLPMMPPSLISLTIHSMEGDSLVGIPTEGNVIAQLHGLNLNAPYTQCIMNGISLVIQQKNATDVFCVIPEFMDALALFSIQIGMHSTNELEAVPLSPVIHSIHPSLGNTAGNELITLQGSHFGNSLSAVQVLFDNQDVVLVHCNHTHIQFVSPEYQGNHIAVQVNRYGRMAVSSFSYHPPFIQTVHVDLQSTQYLVTLTGENFGIHSGLVQIGDQPCAVLQQNHTRLLCLLPLFFGGNKTVVVTVAGQISNQMTHAFPLPFIEVVSPLVIEAVNSTLFLAGLNLPLLSGIAIELSVGSINTTHCHLALTSKYALPFIECHLPELPRGTWPLSLLMNQLPIEIHPDFATLTVICPVNQYASPGSFCQLCPGTTLCPANATAPIAPPGQWIVQTSPDSHESVQCFNPNACVGANQCLEGYHSTFCSQCSSGYSRSHTWTCTRCSTGLKRLFSLVWFVIVCLFIYISSVTRFSSYFIWFTILVEFFQMIGLITSLRPSSPILSVVVDFCSAFVLNVEVFHLDCIFPSLNALQIWGLAAVVLGICIIVDLLLQLFLHRKVQLFSMQSCFVRVSSLLHSLWLPILYHSLQALTCNHSYYMAYHSIQFTEIAMCWTDSNYLWIILVSILLLFTSGLLFWRSFSKARWEKQIALSMRESSQQSRSAWQLVHKDLSNNLLFLGSVYINQSINPFYLFSILKCILAVIVIVSREESHLQSILILLLLLPVMSLLFSKTVYHTQHTYYQRILSRTVLEPLPKSQAVASHNTVYQTVLSDKKWIWNGNVLSALGILLFLMMYFDCIVDIGSLSVTKQIVDITLVSLIVLYCACVVIAGIAEGVSYFTRKPIAFFDRVDQSVPDKTESIRLSSKHTAGMKGESRSQMKQYMTNRIAIPSIPQESDPSKLLQVSLGEMLRNQKGLSTNEDEEDCEYPSLEMRHRTQLFEKKLLFKGE